MGASDASNPKGLERSVREEPRAARRGKKPDAMVSEGGGEAHRFRAFEQGMIPGKHMEQSASGIVVGTRADRAQGRSKAATASHRPIDGAARTASSAPEDGLIRAMERKRTGSVDQANAGKEYVSSALSRRQAARSAKRGGRQSG